MVGKAAPAGIPNFNCRDGLAARHARSGCARTLRSVHHAQEGRNDDDSSARFGATSPPFSCSGAHAAATRAAHAFGSVSTSAAAARGVAIRFAQETELLARPPYAGTDVAAPVAVHVGLGGSPPPSGSTQNKCIHSMQREGMHLFLNHGSHIRSCS